MDFFEKCRTQSDKLWLISSDLAREFSTLHTEIREVDAHLIKKMLDALAIFKEIEVLSQENIVRKPPFWLITVNESISLAVYQKYFPSAISYVRSVFLRYDELKVKSVKPVTFDRQSSELFDRQVMALAFDESEKSADWWRHVGAVLVKERRVVATAYNDPVPSQHMPYVLGNPRDFIEAGTLSHFSDVLHAEKALLASFLKEGVSTRNADIYVSVFPCPDCAKLIAYSGIKRCFFGSGHATLDGERVLKARGVELIYVPLGDSR
jgi:dCMP deaminase